MLSVMSREWDRYFAMCEDGSPAEERLKKLRTCKSGVLNVEDTDFARLRSFLLSNQLSVLQDVVSCTGIGHDVVKDTFFQNRDKFFMFRANALGDQTVLYSTLESQEEDPKKTRERMVRWMWHRGFIDPYFFHQPIGMTIESLCEVLDDMQYPARNVNFGDSVRRVYFAR